MIKEIHEEPKAVKDTISSFVKDGRIDFSSFGLKEDVLSSISALRIIACGSSYHVGEGVKAMVEELCGIACVVEYASEYRYRKAILDPNEAVVFISQSGETADTLAALRITKERGIKTIGVVNVVGSAIARESDYVIYTLAGPEIAVATTKAYSAQLSAMYSFATALAKAKKKGKTVPLSKADICLKTRIP